MTQKGPEAEATIPPFVPIEGHNWFFQISIQNQNQVLTSLHLRSPVARVLGPPL